MRVVDISSPSVCSDRAMAVEMVCGVMVMSRSNGANTMESSRLNIYSYTADTWKHSISW